MFLNSLGVTAHALGSSPHIPLRHLFTPGGIRGYLGPFHDMCDVPIGIRDRIYPEYTLDAILRGLGMFM